MAFKVKTFNHSPQWYHDHCGEEDGGSAAFRAMLNADMKFLEADIDKKMTYMERVDDYEVAWNAALGKDADPTTTGAIQEVLEREGKFGNPQDEYSQGGFKAISRCMNKYGLSTTVVADFLRWKAKSENATKARTGIKKKETKEEKSQREIKEKTDILFGRSSQKSSTGDF